MIKFIPSFFILFNASFSLSIKFSLSFFLFPLFFLYSPLFLLFFPLPLPLCLLFFPLSFLFQPPSLLNSSQAVFFFTPKLLKPNLEKK